MWPPKSQVTDVWFLENTEFVRILLPSRADIWGLRRFVLPEDVEGSPEQALITRFRPLERERKTRLLWLFHHLNRRIEVCIGGRLGVLELPPSPRVPVDAVFPFLQRSGSLCIFVDDHIAPDTVARSGLQDLALVGKLGRPLIERFYHDIMPPSVVTKPPPSGTVGFHRRKKKFDVGPLGIEAGDRVAKLLAPPVEYGGKLSEIRGGGEGLQEGEMELANGTKLPLGYPKGVPMLEGTCKGHRNFDEMHDRVAVALGAGWSFNTCPPWFYTIQDTLMDLDIRTCIHVSLDTNEMMLSAMRAAYGRNRKPLETDGVRRYGALIDSNAVRMDQSLLPDRLRQIWAPVSERPDERLILLKDEGGP